VDAPLWLWITFNCFVLAMLALDLGVFHRKSHEVKFKEALGWSAVWVSMALMFNAWLWQRHGDEVGLQFLTGYVVEKSLSVDNIFVFLMIFAYFQVPAAYQHKVLFWGILGALVMRAIFIFAGVALIERFHWMIYLFGAILILTGVKMLWMRDKKMEPEKNPVIRLFRRYFPCTDKYHEDKFFARNDGRLVATPLFLALILIEFSDLVFAVDSIPAILAITQDPFIVYTSNVFAILGLRSLYFCLAGFMGMFQHLAIGLATVLIFIGGKMVVVDVYKVPIGASLGVIAAILTTSIVTSLLAAKKHLPVPEASTGSNQSSVGG